MITHDGEDTVTFDLSERYLLVLNSEIKFMMNRGKIINIYFLFSCFLCFFLFLFFLKVQ